MPINSLQIKARLRLLHCGGRASSGWRAAVLLPCVELVGQGCFQEGRLMFGFENKTLASFFREGLEKDRVARRKQERRRRSGVPVNCWDVCLEGFSYLAQNTFE